MSVFPCMIIMAVDYLHSFLYAYKVKVCLQDGVGGSLDSFLLHMHLSVFFLLSEKLIIDEIAKLCMLLWPFPFFDLLMNYLLMGCELVVPSSCIVHHQT